MKFKKYLSYYLGLIISIILIGIFKDDLAFAVLLAYLVGYYDLPALIFNLNKD